jgi:hypothetical protein
MSSIQEFDVKRPAISGRQRPGVVLIAVIALLELFAIVGITFVLVADSARPGNRQFQKEVESIGSDTLDLAFELAPVLAAIEDDEGGVPSAFSDDLGRLSARAGDLRVRVLIAYDRSDDRRERTDLLILDRRLQQYLAHLCSLREIIELINRGS